jgi:hypothetical protein
VATPDLEVPDLQTLATMVSQDESIKSRW